MGESPLFVSYPFKVLLAKGSGISREEADCGHGQRQELMSTTLERVKDIAARIAADQGVEVLELELKGSGKTRCLRIFLDKPEGVSHTDCEAFSREISRVLDVEDTVPGGEYTLEVSSPGLDRKIYKASDYERFNGKLLEVELFEAREGARRIKGRLTAFDGERVTVDTAEAPGKKPKLKKGETAPVAGPVVIELREIEKARLIPEF